jgi:hypothetical protein
MEGPFRQGAVGCGLQNCRPPKEHGDKWKLNEEPETPVVDAHSTPRSFTEAHNQKKDRS